MEQSRENIGNALAEEATETQSRGLIGQDKRNRRNAVDYGTNIVLNQVPKELRII